MFGLFPYYLRTRLPPQVYNCVIPSRLLDHNHIMSRRHMEMLEGPAFPVIGNQLFIPPVLNLHQRRMPDALQIHDPGSTRATLTLRMTSQAVVMCRGICLRRA